VQTQRNTKGYTILELMVAISLIGIVIGMLYLYNNRGWVIFNKSISYSKLQTDARSALQQMVNNIRKSSCDLVYTSNTFNSQVPLPEDFIYGKPYIYFAVPHKQDYQAREIKSRESTVNIPNYDYYLYYIAKSKNKDGETTLDRAKLKLFLIKNISGDYTVNNLKDWPFLPPQLEGKSDYRSIDGVKSYGTGSKIEYQDYSPEFSLYQSEFSYNYYNTNYDKLFKIRVKLVDPENNTKLDYETAVTPRN
jgi:prepilin-type N-terminal cleavage/methylation domain-containing protein